MRNKITTKELIEQRFSKADAEKIIKEAEIEIENIRWGGARENSGRKPKNGVVLKFTKRLSEKEVKFINYAREHHINYDDLMQG